MITFKGHGHCKKSPRLVKYLMIKSFISWLDRRWINEYKVIDINPENVT